MRTGQAIKANNAYIDIDDFKYLIGGGGNPRYARRG